MIAVKVVRVIYTTVFSKTAYPTATEDKIIREFTGISSLIVTLGSTLITIPTQCCLLILLPLQYTSYLSRLLIFMEADPLPSLLSS